MNCPAVAQPVDVPSRSDEPAHGRAKDDLRPCRTLVAPGHARLPLADAKRAHEMLDARAALGKIILKP
jgi:hypothetical protein